MKSLPKCVFPTNEELDITQNNYTIASKNNVNVDYKNVVCKKPWGHEFLIYQNDKVAIWFLKIVKGHSTSLHCHFKKDTLLTTLSGCGKIVLINNEVIELSPLQSVFIPRNKFHALTSFSDEVYFMEMEIFGEELSFTDKNDLLRIDDIYKRDNVGYEASIDRINNSKETTSAFNTFYLEKTNVTYNVQGIDMKLVNTLSEMHGNHLNILLQGNVYCNGSVHKEGSVLTDNNTYYVVSNPSNLRILTLKNAYASEDSKIIYNMDHLAYLQQQLAKENKRIVLTSGCYDIIHVGHLHHLKAAKQSGDVLIVCLSNDDQIKKLKGHDRPINNYKDRIDLFKTISYVDYIILYDETDIEREETLGNIMKVVKPSVWTKGDDYTKEQILKKHPYLSNIVLIPNIENKSTTNIINKITNKI